jgi:6-pyruvoyl-tetrahydropterin synthase
MYSVEVRDRIMIAHSFADTFFGPAQRLHGATYVVDVAFFREALNAHNVVVDIGAAAAVLRAALEPLAYHNLDALPQFQGILTTTEFLCKHVFESIVEAARTGALGTDGMSLHHIRVSFAESDVARASYEGAVGG